MTSTGNSITLKMTTDTGWNKLGFSATWATVTNGVVEDPSLSTPTSVSICDNTALVSGSATGTLTDGTPGNVYWANQDCEMTIEVAAGSQVEMTFTGKSTCHLQLLAILGSTLTDCL